MAANNTTVSTPTIVRRVLFMFLHPLKPFPLIAIRLAVRTALKHVRELSFSQAFGRVPHPGLLIAIHRPSQTSFVLPGRAQGCFLAVTEEVTSFMQQHGRAFTIIDRNFKEFRAKRHDLKWEIGGGISIPVTDIVV